MLFLNQYEIRFIVRTFVDGATPNLCEAAITLQRLAAWTDDHSDGWAYWPKPARSARALMKLLKDAQSAWLTGGFVCDVSKADVNKACVPIKSFLTRHGVSHGEVF